MQERITWSEYLLVPLEEALLSLVTYLPSVLAALTILVVGWIFAVLVRWFVGKSLAAAQFDKFAQRTQLNVMWRSVGVQSDPHAVVARLVYWLLLALVALTVLNTLEIAAMQALSVQLIGYLPDLVAGVLVLVIGLFVANRLRRRLREVLDRFEGPTAEAATTGGYSLMVALVVTAALRKLGIDTGLFEALLVLLVACVGLAFALAFGLAGKDRAARLLARTDAPPEEASAEPEGE